MRVTLVGYGAVAAIHARAVHPCAVFGPTADKAEKFAREHYIPRASSDLGAALEGADAAIVCSPSQAHFEQALCTLERGLATLVELPACSSAAESKRLRTAAATTNALLRCAHTGRYLAPYRLIGEWLAEGRLGEVCSVQYTRSVPVRQRSWTDDALLHHAGHPLDLLLHWFGAVHPLSCAALPSVPGAQDVALNATLPDGAPASVTVSYTARLHHIRMTIAGTGHTVATDGFSFIESDDPKMRWSGDANATYEQAIIDQDKVFLEACRTGQGGVPWQDTLALAELCDEFALLWKVGRTH